MYVVNLFLIYFWNILLLLKKKNSSLNKKIYCIIVSTQWILLTGLRDLSIGSDTISYYGGFTRVQNKSWTRLWYEFTNTYFGSLDEKDPGYGLLTKFIQLFTEDYRVFMFIVGMLFMIPFGIFIYKYSETPCTSFIIYSCLFYSFFSITGYRQSIATGLVCIIGYTFIKKRKLLPFILISILAFTIHKSCLVFFPFYFIANIKINKKTLFIYGASAAILIIFNKLIYVPIASILNYEDYALNNDIGGTTTYVIIMLMLSVVVIWRGKYLMNQNDDMNVEMNGFILAVISSVLTLNNQSFMRIQQYYSLFIVLIIPKIIMSFEDDREKIISSLIANAGIVLLYLRNVPDYKFFWQ